MSEHDARVARGAQHSVLHGYTEAEARRRQQQAEAGAAAAVAAARAEAVPPIDLPGDKENRHPRPHKDHKDHHKDHHKNHHKDHKLKHHKHHKHHKHGGKRKKGGAARRHKHGGLAAAAPSPPPRRRLSASFQPVSWSDFAAVERKLTKEALEHVNEPARVEELRREALQEARLYLESNDVWSLAEDRVLLACRAFAIQEDFEKVQARIMEMPDGKRRSLGALAARADALMCGMPKPNVPKTAAVAASVKKQDVDAVAAAAAVTAAVTAAAADISQLGPAERALAQRGRMLRHDLIGEFLQRGTGYALSQGVRESDLAGDSEELVKKAEAAAQKRKRMAAAGRFVADPTQPPPNLASDMMLLCGRQTVQANKGAATRCSPLLAALVNNDESAVKSTMSSIGIERKAFDPLLRHDPAVNGVRLNPDAAEGDGIDLFGCLDKGIVTRFAKFASDPAMVERGDILRNATIKRRERADQLRVGCAQQVEMERHRAIVELRKAQEQESDELREYLEDQMKAEVEAVQLRHMQIRLAEEDHLRSRHRDQDQIVNVFFDEETTRVRELGKPPPETAAVQLKREQQLEHNEQAITSVFGGADAMRLLLLSELLAATDLVDSCTRVLSQNRPPADWLPDEEEKYINDGASASVGAEKSGDKTAAGARVHNVRAKKQRPVIRRAPPLVDYLEGPGRLVRIFQSPLVSDATITSVVQRLNTRALMALEAKTSGGSGETSERLGLRVRRELKSRRVMMKSEYEHLTHEGLKKVKKRADKFVQELQNNGGAFFRDELFAGSGGGGGGGGSSSDGGDEHETLVSSAGVDGQVHSAQDAFDEPPFVDVLEEELQRRRRAHLVCFNPETLPDTLSLSYDRMRVTLERASRYATAQATIPRRSGEFGRWMFEVEIVTLPTVGCTVSVGFDVPLQAMSWTPHGGAPAGGGGKDRLPSEPLGRIRTVGQIGGRGVAFPGHSKDESGRCGYAWQGDGRGRKTDAARGSSMDTAGLPQPFGAFHVAGRTFTAPSSFAVGDVISVCLDQDHSVPRLFFLRNGRRVRLGDECEKYLRDLARANAWKERRKHVDVGSQLSSDDLPVVNQDYVLVPAVCLYSANRMPDRDAKPCVRANFKGPFQFPQVGFEPYGGMPSAH
jgi:hypothetical protein